MKINLDDTMQKNKPKHMDHPYIAGKNDMREQILAFIYERYCYNRTFFGKESQTAMELKRIILDIREDQAQEGEIKESTLTDE